MRFDRLVHSFARTPMHLPAFNPWPCHTARRLRPFLVQPPRVVRTTMTAGVLLRKVSHLVDEHDAQA